MNTKIRPYLITLLCVAVGSLSAGNLNELLWKKDFDKALEVIKKHPESVQFVNDNGISPLHVACSQGRIDLAKVMLAAGADIHHRDNHKRTVLIKAIWSGNSELAKLLIKKGVDVNATDKWGNSPMHFVAYGDKVEIAQMLLKAGAEIDGVNQSNNTPLLSAIWGTKPKAASLFIEQGADVTVVNVNGETALYLAAQRGMGWIVDQLLAKGANPDITDTRYGRTSLHCAAIGGYIKIAKAIGAKSKALKRKDKRGHSFKDYLAIYSPKQETAVAEIAEAASEGEAVIHYTGHSGWVVRTKNNILVFDYWKPNNAPDQPSLRNGYLTAEETDGLPVTVFVSHDHGDHFDKKALKSIKGASDNVSFVYGFDPKSHLKKKTKKDAECCPESKNEKAKAKSPPDPTKKQKAHFVVLKPRVEKQMDRMIVSTINSVDSGVGFLVEVDGVSIFHAGDHACLSAEDSEAYFAEINHLVANGKSADIQFLPVSGCPNRWKADFVKKGFFKTAAMLKAKSVFPMHGLRREFSYQEFEDIASKKGCSYQVNCAENPGDSFMFKSADSSRSFVAAR